MFERFGLLFSPTVLMLVFLKKTETFKKIHKTHEILSLLLQTSLLVIPSKTNVFYRQVDGKR
jgi:hypothetical protein